jgi:hypothetical protein
VIRSHAALLRHAQDFFLSDLVGLYSFQETRVAPPELRPAIPPDLDYRKRRAEMEKRQGLGKYIEMVRIQFLPWEILIYSAAEKPPLGEVVLREFDSGWEAMSGPLDPATWAKIGAHLRAASQRQAG